MQQNAYPWRPLGDVLVARGLITAEELEEALAEQQRTCRRLGEILVARAVISAEELTRALAEQCGLELELEPGDLQAVATPESSEAAEVRPWRPLGRVLIERGTLTEPQLREALAEQSRTGRRLGEVLIEHGYVAAAEVVLAVIEQHGLGRPETDEFAVSVARAEDRDHSGPRSTSTEPTHEVHVVDLAGRERTILFAGESFLDATDFAFEFLEVENPDRLEILRSGDLGEEPLWAYDAREAAKVAGQSRNLVDVYGFDVTRWTGPPSHEP